MASAETADVGRVEVRKAQSVIKFASPHLIAHHDNLRRRD